MKSILLSAMIAITLFFVSACNGIASIQGSKNITSENRDISTFSEISIATIADLTLIQGDSETLIIEADDNLLQYIETNVSGNTLNITTRSNTNITPSQPIKITLTFKNLTDIVVSGDSRIVADTLSLDSLAIAISGSGNVSVNNITLTSFKADVSGSGLIQLVGITNSQEITLDGSGNVNNFGLISETTTVDISGSGEVEVAVSSRLDVNISGSGEVYYKGNPSVTREITGDGTIVKSE